MTNIFQSLAQVVKNSTWSKVAIAAFVPVVAIAGALLPNAFSVSRANNSDTIVCSDNAPTSPQFNIYPLTFAPQAEDCKDYPLIQMKKVNGGSYASSASEWQQGVTGTNGDVFFVTLYIHNGASNTIDRAQTTAKNVMLDVNVPTQATAQRYITAHVSADNAVDTLAGQFLVTTGANEHLEVVPNSGQEYDYKGYLVQSGFDIGNKVSNIGDLQACFNYAIFMRFQVKVVGNTPPVDQNTTLGITKQVRNLSTGNGFSGSTDAKSGDIVEYKVVVSNTGNSTAKGVFMTDNLQNSGINITGNPVVSTSYSGQLYNGLNLGNIPVGQSVTITYQGNVTQNSVSVTNVAVATASNANRVDARAVVNTPAPSKGNIVITKQVRNITQGTSFSKSTNAKSGDTVEYQIYVNVNSGNVTNATYSDTLPSGFNLNTSSVRINGNNVSSSQATFANLGNMSQGQSATITFQGTVSGYNNTLTNTACAVGDNVQQSCDTATVYVQTIYNPGTSNVVQSKKAWNDTKNQDAQSINATREDYITYTLTVTNTGTANADNYVIQDDLSGVLPFADMVDNGGGSLNGNTLVYNGVTIPVNGSVSKTFKVRVKYNLPANLSYQLVNTYGNTVRINIVGTQVTGPIIAPKTGVDTQTAAGFGGIITLAAAMVIKRKTVLGFILNK